MQSEVLAPGLLIELSSPCINASNSLLTTYNINSEKLLDARMRVFIIDKNKGRELKLEHTVCIKDNINNA